MSSSWLHGEEGGAPSIITTGHHRFIVRAAADAELAADGSDFFRGKRRRKRRCHGHGFSQIRTPRTMRIDYEVRRRKLRVNAASAAGGGAAGGGGI